MALQGKWLKIWAVPLAAATDKEYDCLKSIEQQKGLESHGLGLRRQVKK